MPPHPTTAQVSEQLERIVASETFRNAERLTQVLRFIVEASVQGKLIKEFDIGVDAFGKGTDFNPDYDTSVRGIVRRLREKLQTYYKTEGRGDPIIIRIPKGRYKATFSVAPEEPFKDSTNYEVVKIHLRHRSMKRERFTKAFLSGSDVLLLTVMSQHNLKELPLLLDKAMLAGTRLRVLTWDSKRVSADAIHAYRRHIYENLNHPDRTVAQVEQAGADWDSFASTYNILRVKKYHSSPTMQGYFVNGPEPWAVIELQPFACQPSDRPALLLTEAENPMTFNLFHDAFEFLWEKAESEY